MDAPYLIIIQEKDNGFSAYSPDLPGCIATGLTYADVERHMQDAIAVHLYDLQANGLPIPERMHWSSLVGKPRVLIQRITTDPSPVTEYVDYLINLLMQRGSGVLQADYVLGPEPIDWNFRQWSSQQVETVWPCPSWHFRPLMACLANRVGINVYGGHTHFCVQFDDEAEPYPGKFTLYLSNSGVYSWAKLSLIVTAAKPETETA